MGRAPGSEVRRAAFKAFLPHVGVGRHHLVECLISTRFRVLWTQAAKINSSEAKERWEEVASALVHPLMGEAVGRDMVAALGKGFSSTELSASHHQARDEDARKAHAGYRKAMDVFAENPETWGKMLAGVVGSFVRAVASNHKNAASVEKVKTLAVDWLAAGCPPSALAEVMAKGVAPRVAGLINKMEASFLPHLQAAALGEALPPSLPATTPHRRM